MKRETRQPRQQLAPYYGRQPASSRVAWVVRRFHAHEKRLTASCRAWKREEARSSLPLLAWKREEADYFGRCVSILTPMHNSPSFSAWFSAIAALSDLHLILHPAQHSWLGLPPDTARLSVHVHSGTARGGLIQHVAHAVHSAGGRCAKGALSGARCAF